MSLIMPSPQKEATEQATDLGQETPGLRGQVLSSGSQRQVVPAVPGARLQEAGSEVQVSPKSQVSPGEISPSPQRGRVQRFLSLQRRGKGQSASVSQEAKQRPCIQRPLSHWALRVQDWPRARRQEVAQFVEGSPLRVPASQTSAVLLMRESPQ